MSALDIKLYLALSSAINLAPDKPVNAPLNTASMKIRKAVSVAMSTRCARWRARPGLGFRCQVPARFRTVRNISGAGETALRPGADLRANIMQRRAVDEPNGHRKMVIHQHIN